MANSCRRSPVVFRRNGTKIEEVDSKLFQDLKAAVKDTKAAWEMWALSNTKEFRQKFKNLEYDELGEVTFPSFIKALGLTQAYERDKNRVAAARQYGFDKAEFEDPKEGMRSVNDFNSKESKFVATLKKETRPETSTPYWKAEVQDKSAASVQTAREQANNVALAQEIVDLLRKMGFDVGFFDTAEYNGIFDPENATLVDGLLQIIRIAKTDEGLDALPEEFSHAMIEGLWQHPLVQRLIESLTGEQVQEVLGNSYENYYQKYEGNQTKLVKEAAGKLLAEYIKSKGTILSPVAKSKASLLSRIWNWIKSMFSKVSNKDIENARLNAHNQIAAIYNLITRDDVVKYVDREAIVSADKLYMLSKSFKTAEEAARSLSKIQASVTNTMLLKGQSKKLSAEDLEAGLNMEKQISSDNYTEAICDYLKTVVKKSTELHELIRRNWAIKPEEHLDMDMQTLRDLSITREKCQLLVDAHQEALLQLMVFNQEENIGGVGVSEEQANRISQAAHETKKILDLLESFVHNSATHVAYNLLKSEFKQDRVKGVGKERNEIMTAELILDHADKDISWVERELSALSNASDPLLVVVDRLVKNQKYDRDQETADLLAQLELWDRELRQAGYTSDFMCEMNEDTPTGRIISPYDFEAYNKDLQKIQEELMDRYGDNKHKYRKALYAWKNGIDPKTGLKRLLRVYVNPEYDAAYKAGKSVPEDAIYEEVPNPLVYKGKKDVIDNLADPQKKYYEKVMNLKREMMCLIPHRGQGIYKAVYISKDLVEGIMDNSTGNPLKATLDYHLRKVTRRPDDIGFGADTQDLKESILEVLGKKLSNKEAAEEIIDILDNAIDNDIYVSPNPLMIERILRRGKDDAGNFTDATQTMADILDYISHENFYLIDTDFANHRIQRLPVYYTRRLKDMKMLSTDFTATLSAYCGMAKNYEKMNEIVDILEAMRDYAHDRKILETTDGSIPAMTRLKAFGKVYRGFVEKAGNGGNIGDRLDDYMASAVYEERKETGDTFQVFGVNLDTVKTLDALKDYTGLLGLGLNVFSSISNLAVGKVQMWIESCAGEFFGFKDYALACWQYSTMLPECLAEMGSNIKKNKLSLLIREFDPMGDYYEQLRNPHHSKHLLSKLLGNQALGYIGMNAGEHILHCQTMLAVLNATKLIDTTNNNAEISLFDALEVVEDEKTGVTRLKLKDGLEYKRVVIDNTGELKKDEKGKYYSDNKNYGKPMKDDEGKVVYETVKLETEKDIRDYLFKKQRVIRKVNDTMHGAFSADDKGAIHRKAVLRLVMQFRQWMPAHYARRFGQGYYDADLESWREGYYRTAWRVVNQLSKDLTKFQWNYQMIEAQLSDVEKRNLRRAGGEAAIFTMLWVLTKLGGRVKNVGEEDWARRMALYQIHRMYLEVGASFPLNPLAFLSNIITLLQSPAASISTFKAVQKILDYDKAFDEIQTGRYQGWTELERNLFEMVPYGKQIKKGMSIDDSMFSMFPSMRALDEAA